MSSKKGCFWAFFWRKKSFPGKTVDFNLYHVLQILKAIGPEVNLSYQSSLSKPPTSRQNFANTLQPHCALYLTLCPSDHAIQEEYNFRNKSLDNSTTIGP